MSSMTDLEKILSVASSFLQKIKWSWQGNKKVQSKSTTQSNSKPSDTSGNTSSELARSKQTPIHQMSSTVEVGIMPSMSLISEKASLLLLAYKAINQKYVGFHWRAITLRAHQTRDAWKFGIFELNKFCKNIMCIGVQSKLWNGVHGNRVIWSAEEASTIEKFVYTTPQNLKYNISLSTTTKLQVWLSTIQLNRSCSHMETCTDKEPTIIYPTSVIM